MMRNRSILLPPTRDANWRRAGYHRFERGNPTRKGGHAGVTRTGDLVAPFLRNHSRLVDPIARSRLT